MVIDHIKGLEKQSSYIYYDACLLINVYDKLTRNICDFFNIKLN